MTCNANAANGDYIKGFNDAYFDDECGSGWMAQCI